MREEERVRERETARIGWFVRLCGVAAHVPQEDGHEMKKTIMNEKYIEKIIHEYFDILPFSGAKWSIIQCIVYRSNENNNI